MPQKKSSKKKKSESSKSDVAPTDKYKTRSLRNTENLNNVKNNVH